MTIRIKPQTIVFEITDKLLNNGAELVFATDDGRVNKYSSPIVNYVKLYMEADREFIQNEIEEYFDDEMHLFNKSGEEREKRILASFITDHCLTFRIMFTVEYSEFKRNSLEFKYSNYEDKTKELIFNSPEILEMFA